MLGMGPLFLAPSLRHAGAAGESILVYAYILIWRFNNRGFLNWVPDNGLPGSALLRLGSTLRRFGKLTAGKAQCGQAHHKPLRTSMLKINDTDFTD
jgi:hypothetical protein